jgi:hypothetical protein
MGDNSKRNNIFREYIYTMESVKVFLTTQQKGKLQSGKTFQLSASALQAGSGKHAVEIQRLPRTIRRY